MMAGHGVLDGAAPRPVEQPRPARRRGSHGTLEDCYTGRDNGIGFIRLALASAVVVTHATSLGFGWEDLGLSPFHEQTNLGTMAVFAFFVLSGLLITRSAERVSLPRFAWHRALRILPGLWVCLLVTAFAVAPLVALHERGTLDGFWQGPRGPLQYVWANWFTGVRQYGIHDLLAESTPWGRETGSSVFNGALWSLVYEALCYVMAGVLAATTIMRRAPWLVLGATAGLYTLIVLDQLQGRQLIGPPATAYSSTNLPLLGRVFDQWLIYLGFLFLTGALLQRYQHRIPIHDALGAVSALLLTGSLLVGGFFIVGLPAMAYLLVWLAVRMPRPLRRVGRRHDYSYGVYIYGFVGQQVLTTLGWQRWGYSVYTALSLAVAFGAAYLSWHLVERRALRLKGWQPRWPRRPGRNLATDRPDSGRVWPN